MTAKIQVRRDTTTNWNAGTPPTLDVGEIGLDTTLKQIKIGDGSSNWTALPWLGGTLPYNSSPNANIDDVSLRAAGLYRWSDITAITSGTVPASPIDIKAADGGINMLVLAFGAVILQHLWTDGDGTQPQKSYTRIYDTAYRAWTPQNIWGFSATEGVDVSAKSINLKDTTTSITAAGIISASAGTAAAPAITTTGDTNTGIAFTAADTIVIGTGGLPAITVGPAQGATFAAAIAVTGNAVITGATTLGPLAVNLNANGVRLTAVGDPVNAQDAVTKAFLEANRLGQVYLLQVSGGNISFQQGGLAASSIFTGSTLPMTNRNQLRSVAGTFKGLIVSTAGYAIITITASSYTEVSNVSLTAQTDYWGVFIRTA